MRTTVILGAPLLDCHVGLRPPRNDGGGAGRSQSRHREAAGRGDPGAAVAMGAAVGMDARLLNFRVARGSSK
ncbi:MAG: hypothetical protein LCH72_15790 [Proteobacteria bacterium]|nr:hypothetical protein [Burkholderiales bacterium]MCA0312119.1 hypothetical protein [Pseudomonadota bacterium]